MSDITLTEQEMYNLGFDEQDEELFKDKQMILLRTESANISPDVLKQMEDEFGECDIRKFHPSFTNFNLTSVFVKIKNLNKTNVNSKLVSSYFCTVVYFLVINKNLILPEKDGNTIDNSNPGKYNSICKICGSPAYVGFSSVECSKCGII
jgi:hypothetical protein